MKYIYIITFIVVNFLLVGCFAKPVVEEVEISLPPQQVNEDTVEPAINISEDTASTGSENNQWVEEEKWDEKDLENIEQNIKQDIVVEWEVEVEVQSDAEIIDSFSKELQELFNDVDNIGS
jgi:hypothetical protein